MITIAITTPNIGLHLTPESDVKKRVIDFRTEQAGDHPGSNMMMLDKAFGDLNTKTKDGYNHFIEASGFTSEGTLGGILNIETINGITVQKAYVHTVGESGQVATAGKNLFDDGALAEHFAFSGGEWSNTKVFPPLSLPVSLPVGPYVLRYDICSPVGCNYRFLVFYADGTRTDSFNASTGEYRQHGCTTDPTKKITMLQLSNSTSNNVTAGSIKIKNIQLEVGAVATPYEPYTGGVASPSPDWSQPITPGLAGGKYQMRTHRGLYECTLPDGHGLGEVRDKVVIDPVTGTGKWVDVCQLKVLDGTEAGWARTDTSTHELLYIQIPGGKSIGYGSIDFLCTHNKPANTSWTSGDVRNTNSNGFQPGWSFAVGTYTLAGWKAEVAARFSSGNPMKLLYKLAAPLITPITLTPVSTSTAPVLPTEYIEYEPSTDVPVTMESPERGMLWSVGRNLLDVRGMSEFLIQSVSTEMIGEQIIITSTTDDFDRWRYALFNTNLQLNPGETYTARFRLSRDYALLPNTPKIFFYGADGARISYENATGGPELYSTSFSVPQGTVKTAIQFIMDKIWSESVPVGSKLTVSELQVEAGAVATAYEPYQGQAYDIPLPQALRAGDSVELVDGRYKQVVRRGHIIAGKDLTVALMEGAGQELHRSFGIYCKEKLGSDEARSSHFECVPQEKRDNKECVYLQYPHYDVIALNLLMSRIGITASTPSSDAIKAANTWLTAQHAAGTPVVVDYDLATPVYLDLPDSTQALLRSIVTAPGVAHLWFEGAVVPSMTAGVPRGTFCDPDKGFIIDSIKHRVSNHAISENDGAPSDCVDGQLMIAEDGTSASQLAIPPMSSRLYVRSGGPKQPGGYVPWQDWARVYTDKDPPSLATPSKDGLMSSNDKSILSASILDFGEF